MRSPKRNIKVKILVLLLVVTGYPSPAQKTEEVESSNDLYKKVYELDSLVFDAFNKRDTTSFNKYFSQELEFYHDQGGLTGYNETVGFLYSLINKRSDLKRTLMKDKLEVYPVPGYGAMEIGEHRFSHTENGKQVDGTFKFLHLWKQENNNWKITRVMSYGH